MPLNCVGFLSEVQSSVTCSWAAWEVGGAQSPEWAQLGLNSMCNAANLKRHEMDGSEQTSMKTIPLKIYEILRNKPQLNASKNGLNGCIE
uniref:AlNc14C278G10070 protein n=1 Tax=Albugo laibachii Nc14 TaxID=890382 RepID=F0WUS0_9STRA|nr:AlNc14C278G10070 [Albugo laibachii Nc14]|eukprot:CCA25156.1 AlNc14C278G10070 [Albugo laibachii Nc14]